MLTLFQLNGLVRRVPFSATEKGPFSSNNPSMLLHPGPPFNHKMSGDVAGLVCDSTNLIRFNK